MFHHASSRNQRPKGSNMKKILKVVVLLAVALWLLYQVKHSHKKAEYSGNDEIKLSKVGEETYLGRKGDAGSENVVIIETDTKGSDESTEMKQDEVKHDASALNNEDNKGSDESTELKQDEVQHDASVLNNEDNHSHELADSQESKAEQHSYPHANDGEVALLLPSEDGNNSPDHNGNSNEGGHNVEGNGHLNDKEEREDVKGDLVVGDDGVEVTMTGDQTTSSSTEQNEGSKKTGEENDETSGGIHSQEISMNAEASKGNAVGSYEHSSSLSETSIDNKVGDRAGDFARPDVTHVSPSRGDAATTKEEVDNAFHESGTVESQSDSDRELKNVDANNEVSKEREVETQLVSSSQVENIDNNSSGENKANREPENGTKNLFSDANALNSSDTSGIGFTDSEQDKVFEQEKSSEANNTAVVELQSNNEAEISQNNPLESINVTNNPEQEISAQGNEVKDETTLNDDSIISPEVIEKISLDDLTSTNSEEEVIQSESKSDDSKTE